jgi:hypothetical protein
MDVSNLVQTIAIYALPVLFAITLHEAAHGYVARHFGDMTAYAQGRISLNPARHIDLVGTILVPIAILLVSKLAGVSGFLFGWAKPVPVNYSALKNPKRDMLWVAAAGPASNLVMAIGWAALYKLADAIGPGDYATPLKADERRRHRSEHGADAAQSAADPAARRRPDRRQPAAGADVLAVFQARALGLSDPALADVFGLPRPAAGSDGRDLVPRHRRGVQVLSRV